MALRDQPYLPLYIQDIMTDEKLNECSAATHGIFIKGIMCLMHKSNTYGKILLKQKHKQKESIDLSFATQLGKHIPYTVDEILVALRELITEGVCHYEGDYLVQKRMVKDNDVSEKRSLSGRKGGNKTQFQLLELAKANIEANSEYENTIEIIGDKEVKGGKEGFIKFPIPEHFNGLPDIKMGMVEELIRISRQITLSNVQITGFWEVFKKQNLTGKKFYETKDDVYSHFVNWMKFQKLDALKQKEEIKTAPVGLQLNSPEQVAKFLSEENKKKGTGVSKEDRERIQEEIRRKKMNQQNV